MKNEIDHSVIRMEIQNVVQTWGERLMKMETEHSPAEFQKFSCPNTTAINLTVKWIEKHEKWHEEKRKEEKELARSQRRLMWTAIITVVSSLTIFTLNIFAKAWGVG